MLVECRQNLMVIESETMQHTQQQYQEHQANPATESNLIQGEQAVQEVQSPEAGQAAKQTVESDIDGKADAFAVIAMITIIILGVVLWLKDL